MLSREEILHNAFASDDSLEHYGVKGMKWGVQRGGVKTRVKNAALDSIQRRKTTNKEISEGRGKVRDYYRTASRRTLGPLTFGSKKVAAKRADKLQGQEDRIKAGKAKFMDIFDVTMNTPISDLFVSRRDRRGD